MRDGCGLGHVAHQQARSQHQLGSVSAPQADTSLLSLTQVGAQLQQVLLERTAHEPTHVVRRALANCIAAVAEPSMAAGQQWPGLMAFLQHCSQAGNAEHKEVALLLFAALFESQAVGESGSGTCVVVTKHCP